MGRKGERRPCRTSRSTRDRHLVRDGGDRVRRAIVLGRGHEAEPVGGDAVLGGLPRSARRAEECCGPLDVEITVYFLQGGLQLFDLAKFAGVLSVELGPPLTFSTRGSRSELRADGRHVDARVPHRLVGWLPGGLRCRVAWEFSWAERLLNSWLVHGRVAREFGGSERCRTPGGARHGTSS